MAACLHATAVVIEGRCVLLLGPSGIGKSDLALRMMDRGATLLADDYVEVRVEDGRLIARAPTTIRGMIEVRGVGLVPVANVDEARIVLIIDLGEPVERLPDMKPRLQNGVLIPAIGLRSHEASAPMKVEAALRRFGLPLEDQPR